MPGKDKEVSLDEDATQEELCEKCGSAMAIEDGIKFCPQCEGNIDYFGEDDDEF